MRPSHRALREGTRAAHDALDALFARFDLTERAGYADFLSAHAQALIPIERALDARAAQIVPDWPERRRGSTLQADLAALGRAPPVSTPFALADDDAAVAGTLYVVEGSRLGGRMLAQRVAPGLPTSYLDPGQDAGKWTFLLDRLDAVLYDGASQSRATAAACDAFAAFHAAGRQWLTKEVTAWPTPSSTST